MKKILLAIDGSECSFRAVEYAGKQFSGMGDVDMMLFHVLPYPPAPLWDEGHIPTESEKAERKRAIEVWLADQRTRTEPLFEKATAILTDAGILHSQLSKKTISDSIDIAGSILEEAKDGEYQTIILGRCGLSAVKKVLGSVTTKVVNHAAGVAVCLVE